MRSLFNFDIYSPASEICSSRSPLSNYSFSILYLKYFYFSYHLLLLTWADCLKLEFYIFNSSTSSLWSFRPDNCDFRISIYSSLFIVILSLSANLSSASSFCTVICWIVYLSLFRSLVSLLTLSSIISSSSYF